MYQTELLANKIRRHVLAMTNLANGAHVGSGFSIADLLAVLYAEILHVDPRNPFWPQRDRFILSKGHAAAALYAVLAEREFFPVSHLDDYCENGSVMGGHVATATPGIEFSSGALGHGLPVAAGMAYAAKQDSANHRFFVLLSDGECAEGSNWEASMFAAHHGLNNLIAIIDYNRLQGIGNVEDTLRLEPLVDKWRSFGWMVREVDGHDHSLIRAACMDLPFDKAMPSCVVAHTTKGKGVSFMENSNLWHYRTARGREYEQALAELEANL